MSRLGICIVAVLSVVLPSGPLGGQTDKKAADPVPVVRESALATPDAPARSTRGLTNDSCFEPAPIFKGATDFVTIGADTDGLPHADCQFDGQTYHDIWFQFVADCNNELTVSTCNSANYDTDLVVYDGCFPDIPCPPDDAFLLVCNDDAPGCAGFTSEVSVPVVAGNCYTIRIGGWNKGDMGTGTLALVMLCEGACGNGRVEKGEECDPPDGVTCDADCQLILCGPDQECCCCPNKGCFEIDLMQCAAMGCTPVDECLGDSNGDGEDDACVDACCLGDGSCKPLSEDECADMEGTPVQACIGDQDGDGRDDACPCQIDADCDDGNPCTLNSCDLDSGMCLAEFAPKTTLCEIDGESCSIEHCDGEGLCVPFGEVVCETACPACKGECDPETGLCPCAGAKVDGNWSDDIWNLEGPNPYPDNNTGVPGLGALIQGLIDVFLDLTVEIESLCLLDGGILRVTAGGTVVPTGDITVIGPEGILIEGTLYVADSHVIDASAGPVTIGANGKYLADPDAVDNVDTVLLADELTILEPPEIPNDAGTMELSDSMQVSTIEDFKLDGTHFSEKGDCTPPDLNVINSGRIEVGGNFIILNAAEVEYSSSVPMSLEGNFDNQSKFPLFFDWTNGGVLLTGGGGNAGPTVHTVEAAGEDFGRCAKGFSDNFALGTLELQMGETVEIVNLIDNQDDRGEGCDEALYVDLLIVNADAVLITKGCRVYYRNLIQIGSIPGIDEDVLEIERADFNEDCLVEAFDLGILLGAWGPCPDPCPPFCLADLSDDCDVEAFDLGILLGKWGPVN